MLSGDWGTGKSYYIQNDLIPFINGQSDSENRCIVLSLYGLKDVNEISKIIYLETRFSLFPKGELFESGKIIGKTVIKGLTSILGFDISQNEKDLINLYKSIDYSGKLIILEDLERSGIGILDVLGYVNNLVEQDGAKVLLVANENELQHYEYSEPDKDGKRVRIPDAATKEYLRKKEKTVSDTIYYYGDYPHAIHGIIRMFECSTLNSFLTEQWIEDIEAIMFLTGQYNLRSFLYACQKTIDIINQIGETEIQKSGHDFVQCMFYGIIAFSLRYKAGMSIAWGKSEHLSTELGLRNSPLFRFCYDYILFQKYDNSTFERDRIAYKNFLLYDHHGSRNDQDIDIVLNYVVHTEEEVVSALNRIEQRLENPKDIPYYDYGKLLTCFVRCHTLLGFDYSLCQERMASNLLGKENEIDTHILFLSCGSDDESEQNQIDEYIQAITASLKNKSQNTFGFNYSPDNMDSLYNEVIKKKEEIRNDHTFISKFDLDKLYCCIFKCNSEQINSFRNLLVSLYKNISKGSFVEDDCLFLISLVSKIKEMETVDDRILMWQRKLLVTRIEEIITQLSRV